MFAKSCYGLLWCFIKILGIDVFESRYEDEKRSSNSVVKRFTNKMMRILFPFMMHLIIIYGIISWSILYAKRVTTIEVLISIAVSNLFSLAIWHDVRRKRNLIKNAVLKGNNLALSLRVTGNNITKVINVCLILSVIIPFGLTVFGALAIKESSREYQMFYSFFSILENGGYAFVLIEGFIILMTYSALLILPALMTILCGTVYYKVSDLFKGICDYLENLNGISYKYSEIFKLLETYNLLLHVCAGNREGFFYDFFSALVLLVLGSLIIIAVVLCASRISFQIRRFRSILQIIHNYMLRNEDSTFKTLQLIRTMMNMEFPRMTAGGILDLEPVLILSVFGSVLTYGLLVINITQH
ncbi:uncharacterized protein CEXT_170491 [Caerostris extrusa]|uniref:Gustatory receptor n=1 Tax=Caerostris extrusa TaxID=172846 RepID=A0AAV4M869_CAEEX|nr:uncharacterized protein CEXT_170491 [Caerostris extrusa]